MTEKTNEKTVKTEYKVKNKPVYSFVKRCFDIFVSGLALILFSWLFIILAIVVKCNDGGKVFFRQKGLERTEKIFLYRNSEL